ncbi:cell division protein FtsZ [Chitinimonas koreensis]|uniref:cell division protein FtsZ n=1 Tax=Chitinimonas koreensis TaxID=356302 RepID=UPI00402BD0F1
MSFLEAAQDVVPVARIKVVGIGGCGGNAVDHMIDAGVTGVEFICANTDAQALKRNRAEHIMQLGGTLTKGLGAGANPDIGRAAAEEDRERIAELLSGADMIFITAGMGGGTGTGAAPVVAQVAREMGILTVGVVTRPFAFEGKRQKAAQNGIEELQKYVDSLIIIPNERLMQVLGDDISFKDAFKAADDVLKGAVAGIAEIINVPGLVNVDFADVRAVMTEMGMAMMGSAHAEGVDRARIAAEAAVASPLLEDISLNGARGVLVNITADYSLKMKEVHEVMDTVKAYTAEDARIIFGTAFDENMGDSIRVTLVATGLGAGREAKKTPNLHVVQRTGTDDGPIAMDYEQYDQPAVFRNGRGAGRTGAAVESPRGNVFAGGDMDIPAFLRKQAD